MSNDIQQSEPIPTSKLQLCVDEVIDEVKAGWREYGQETLKDRDLFARRVAVNLYFKMKAGNFNDD